MLQHNDISETWILSNLPLKKGKEIPLKRFHPYVFSGALESAPPRTGFAMLESRDGEPMAVVQVNPEVGLCGRVFITEPEALQQWVKASTEERQRLIDVWILRKLQSALDLRKNLFAEYFNQGASHASGLGASMPLDSSQPANKVQGRAIPASAHSETIPGSGIKKTRQTTSGFRWINAEGDGFPGLILDYYQGTLVMQISTAATDLLRPALIRHIQSLQSQFPDSLNLLERSDGGFRRAESLPPVKTWHLGQENKEIWFSEHDIRLIADVQDGQKTGFFLDMRCMRELLGTMCENRSVLNLFSYTGGFGLHAIRGGASQIVQVDRSSLAMDISQKQIAENFPEALERSEHHCMDVDQYLRELPAEKKFDIVIADPPAFAKKKSDVKNAVRAYRKLHRSSIQRVSPGGLFLACSCSHFIPADHFQSIVIEALASEGRQGQILSQHRQAPCHPLAANHPEGHYLKSILLRVY